MFCTYAAIATVVTVAEILKNSGYAEEKSKAILSYTFQCLAMLVLHYATSQPSTKLIVNAAEILTYTVDIKAENRARPVQKAKVSSVVLLSR